MKTLDIASSMLKMLCVITLTGCPFGGDMDTPDASSAEEEDTGPAPFEFTLSIEVCEAPTSTEPPAPFTRLDQLWVIDNSGSMCQEQLSLGLRSRRMFELLFAAGIDIHVGITTTHAPGNQAESRDPVAIEGHLQSTPQPLPGYDRECIGTYNDALRRYTDLTPLRSTLEQAVRCMATPDLTLLDVTDAQLDCALQATHRPDCSAEVGGVDRNGDDSYTLDDVLPDPSTFRSIPKVLRSADYTNGGGAVDLDRFVSDFRCASLAGTRGYGLEKGLQAAITATSPTLTGGTADAPVSTTAPNHGLLRSDSAFSLIFVSNENDCSHDGDIFEFGQQCRDAICDYENSADLRGEPSDLTSICDLSDRLRTNLSASKGRDVHDAEILVASIHGNWAPYEGEPVRCRDEFLPSVPTACDGARGVAYSGDRYERFMRQFPNYYPNEVTGGDPAMRLDFENHKESGAMCEGDFSTTFGAIGAQIASLASP